MKIDIENWILTFFFNYIFFKENFHQNHVLMDENIPYVCFCSTQNNPDWTFSNPAVEKLFHFFLEYYVYI